MANILKFKRVAQYTPSADDAGAIVFESGKKILHVVTSNGTSEIYSGVRAAKIENKKLIITNEAGVDLTIDFSDVASATEVANALKVIKVNPSNTIPLANSSTGSAGTGTTYARGDHRHPLQESISKLDHNIQLSLTGAATGNVSNVDFSGNNVSINVTELNANKINGVIPLKNIPSSAIERLFVVDDVAAAVVLLKNGEIQIGDVVQVTEDNKMYFCVNDQVDAFEDGFKEFTAGTASAVEWSGIKNIPATVPTSVSESGEGNVYVGHTVTDSNLTLKKGKVVSSIDGKAGAFTVKNETTNLKVKVIVSNSNEISAEVVGIGTMAGKNANDYSTTATISSTYETKTDANTKKQEFDNLKTSLEAGNLYWAAFTE